MELNYLFKNKILNELFTKYDFIKTLIQENEKNSDNDDSSGETNDESLINKGKIKCRKIIESLKFIFDKVRNIHERSVNNLAVYIDKFLAKRKIDIRADIKAVERKIKENESLNAQRNKDIKDTLDDLKYKIKGYSAKKEKKNIENEKNEIKGRKIIFEDNENDKNDIFEDKKTEKEKVKEKVKKEDEQIQNERSEVKENINENNVIEEKSNEEVKEEKITGKKRLREKKKNADNSQEKSDKEIPEKMPKKKKKMKKDEKVRKRKKKKKKMKKLIMMKKAKKKKKKRMKKRIRIVTMRDI